MATYLIFNPDIMKLSNISYLFISFLRMKILLNMKAFRRYFSMSNDCQSLSHFRNNFAVCYRKIDKFC